MKQWVSVPFTFVTVYFCVTHSDHQIYSKCVSQQPDVSYRGYLLMKVRMFGCLSQFVIPSMIKLEVVQTSHSNKSLHLLHNEAISMVCHSTVLYYSYYNGVCFHDNTKRPSICLKGKATLEQRQVFTMC